MFVTGMGMDLNEENIMSLMYECVRKEISGLVLLTHSEYMSQISEDMMRRADEIGLPLFDMSWNIKLIDVTKEIANYIMELTSNQNKEKELLNEVLFSQDLDEKRIIHLINQSRLSLDRCVFVAEFRVLDQFKREDLPDEYITNKIKSMIDKSRVKSVVGFYENRITCLLELENKNDFARQKEMLIAIYNQISRKVEVSLSIGSVCENLLGARKSYKEATQAFELYKCNDWDLQVIDYEKIGFYKILFEVSNDKKLREYCDEVLGEIIKNDKNTDLLKTLRIYLKNNCNLIHTSREMFIHRNTLIYRLNKIKTILNSHLEDQVLRNELMNALMIYDYLKCIQDNK